MSAFLPAMNVSIQLYQGHLSGNPDALVYGIPAGFWFSHGRESIGVNTQLAPIVAQLAVPIANFRPQKGWAGIPPQFSYGLADYVQIRQHDIQVFPFQFSVVNTGVMWYGTPSAHARFDLANYPDLNLYPSDPGGSPPTGINGLPLTGGRSATFDIYRPFGAAVPTLVSAPGVLYPDPYGGRGSYSGGNYLSWSDVLTCADTVDIRDNLSRASGLDILSYSDGDEVRFPTGTAVSRYVVVHVYRYVSSNGTPRKAVYLLRDSAHWPGP